MSEFDFLKATPYLEVEHWWEWQIPLYLFLGGIAAGVMVLAAARVLVDPNDERSRAFRLLTWLSPLLLSLGMLALWLDLEKRWQVYRFYLAFRPLAPMSWGAWILLAVYPFTVLFALGEVPESFRGPKSGGNLIQRLARWAAEPKRKRRLAWGTAIVGSALGIYTGVLLSAMSARPLWSSSVLGPLFLVSGLSTAAAVLLLFPVGDSERRALGKIDFGLIALELTLLGLFLFTLATGSSAQQAAADLVFGGPYTVVFWTFVILGGLGVPLIAEAREFAGHRGSRWFVPVLILVGGLALRWILVAAGQTSSWQQL